MNSLLNPELIEAASSSNLGIFSLMILVLAVIALVFFRKAPVAVQLSAFIPLFLGVAGFGYAIVGAKPDDNLKHDAPPPQTVEASPQASATPSTEKQFKQTNVSITSITGSGKDNETDAIISVTLIGETGSHAFTLNNKGNDRENGEIDTYLLKKSPDIGPLREAIFQIRPQTGQDFLDDWFVKSFSVIDKNRGDIFDKTANAWIGDGKKASMTYKLTFN